MGEIISAVFRKSDKASGHVKWGIMGDSRYTNIDVEYIVADLRSERFTELLRGNFLHQIINQPTRCSIILDFVLSNTENTVGKLEVIDKYMKAWHRLYFSACSEGIWRQNSHLLSRFVRKLLDFRKVSSVWEKVSAVMMFKKGDKSPMSHYRPSSLTSVVRKLPGFIITRLIHESINKYNMISESQDVFTKVGSNLTNQMSFFGSHTKQQIRTKNIISYISILIELLTWSSIKGI